MICCAPSAANPAENASVIAAVSDASAAANQAVMVEAVYENLWLQIDINHQELDETVLILRTRDGAILLAEEDLERWRISSPPSFYKRVSGKNYYRLQSITGAKFRLEETTQKLFIEMPPLAFQSLSLDSARAVTTLAGRANFGMFLNYDLLGERASGDSRVSSLIEFGTFNAYGVGIGTFIASHSNTVKRVIRLETGWTYDQPANLASLRLGDTVSRAASTWGIPIRYAGLQYASNFLVQPGFLTMQQQAVTGQAALPSTVEVFVNNALVSRNEVPPGPFSVSNIPVITGQGDVRVVVRDLLGREQISNQPFFASARLLRSGLNDYSYELGKERRNYGVQSNDYGRWLAAATYRRGVNEFFTLEGHAEAMTPTQQTVGLNGTWAIGVAGAAGTVNAATAGSRSATGHGYLAALGFDIQKGNLNVSGNWQSSSAGFAQIGLEQGQQAPRQLANFSTGYSAGRFGNVGLGYLTRDTRVSPKNAFFSLSYNNNIGTWAYFGAAILKGLGESRVNSVSVFLNIPIDSSTSASVSTQRTIGSGGASQANAQIQRGLPAGDGVGYRFQGSHNGPVQAEVSYQNAVGTYNLGIASQGGETAYRTNISGGLALIGGNVFASRRIVDSFALVQVPGYQNVKVYVDNQVVALTDKNGNALLPRIRPYERSAVTIDSTDLPLDAKVDALALDAVPFFRSGVVLQFPVSRARGATLRIQLANRVALPSGARVQIAQQSEDFPVAADGEVYLSGLSEQNVLYVRWRGQACRIPVTYLASNDPVPYLGIFLCEGVNP